MRPGRVAARPQTQKKSVFQTVSIPAPTLGLIANNNIATPQPGSAFVLENILPTATGAQLRRGSQRHAQVGLDNSPVTTMFAYINGNISKKFAATEAAIYDVTTLTYASDQFLTAPDGSFLVDDTGELFPVIVASPDEKVSSLTGGNWSVVQFATSAGVFLRLVNGVDTPLVYDGADFDTSPAITSLDESFDPENLSYTWVHQQREFFIEKDTLSAWYLPADAIGGAAAELPLAGVFNLGGSLLFGSTWSLETGAGGLSEQCIFVTTEGEVAVYQGTDPSTAATWAKVGLYKIGKPLGPDAHFRAGGDIVIATDIGLIPLSQALQKDFAVLSPSAVSSNIETIWNSEVRLRQGHWNCAVWSRNQIAIVAPVKLSGQDAVMYAANTRTGAWGKISGWDATCLLVHDDRLFYGTADGRVIEANVTGLDVGDTFTGTYVPAFTDLGSQGVKTTGMSRAVLRALSSVNDQITMMKEYDVNLPAPPDASTVSAPNSWGEGEWGQALWGAGLEKSTYATWRSTPCNGQAVAPALQITSGSASPIDAEIVKIDVTFQLGDPLA